MAEILVAAFGGFGDTYPFLALAVALRDRGHRVRFAALARFADAARACNLEFAGYPEALPPASPPTRGPLRDLRDTIKTSWLYQGFARHASRKRITTRIGWLYQLIAAQPRETIVVAHANALGARIAQEKLGVHLVTVQLQPIGFRSRYDAPGLPLPHWSPPALRELLWSSIDVYLDRTVTPSVNRFRAELALEPMRRVYRRWLFSPELVIGLFPAWFGPPQPDWPPNVHTTGFVLFDGGGSLPPKVSAFLDAGPPPLVFTRGSHGRSGHVFFETALAICNRLGRRGLLLGGDTSSTPAHLPANVCWAEYAPLSLVLPRSAALVHHGGLSTTAFGLAAGVPQLVVPLYDDQPDNAGRVERLGAGMQLTPGAFRRQGAEHLRTLLESTQVASVRRQLAHSIQAQHSLADTCSLIERLIDARA